MPIHHAYRRLTGSAVVLASVIAASGCGSSGSGSKGNGEAAKTGPQVVKDAAAALRASGSAHLRGTMVDPTTKATETLALVLITNGASGALNQAGVVLNLIAIGSATYAKAPAAFYTAQKVPAAAAAQVADKWVKLPAGTDLGGGFTLTSLADAFSQAKNVQDKVATGTLDGQSVVIVKQADGSQLFVAGTGKPYPLKTVNTAKSADGAGTNTLSEFGKKVDLKAPAGAIAIPSS